MMGRVVSGRMMALVLALPAFLCYLFLATNNSLHTHPLPEEGDPDDLWWADWDEVQRSRRADLYSECRQIKKAQVKSFSKLVNARRYLYNLLVDDRHKAIYCYVPKVACTNWKRLMMILSGRTNEINPLNISSHIPHEEGVLTRLSGTHIKSSVLRYKLRTYTKFLIVRHPLERLVSAYRNKLVINSTSAAEFKRKYGVIIMKKYRKGIGSQNISKSGHGVTFPEFANYIVEKGEDSLQSLNEHWAPYVDLCHPCTIKYNIIGKYETLDEDSEYILRKIGAPPDLHFPPLVASRTASLVADHMASLTQELSQRLYNIYKFDFKLFEYDYPNL